MTIKDVMTGIDTITYIIGVYLVKPRHCLSLQICENPGCHPTTVLLFLLSYDLVTSEAVKLCLILHTFSLFYFESFKQTGLCFLFIETIPKANKLVVKHIPYS